MNTRKMTTDEQIHRAFIVEDDRALRELLVEELEEMGFEVRAFRVAEEAAEAIGQWTPELVISDLRLPGMSGVELLQYIRRHFSEHQPAFVMITAFGTISQAVEALKVGADDFLTKPLDLDHLRLRVQRLMDVQHLKREVQRYRQVERPSFHAMVGKSPPMKKLFEDIRQISTGRGPVMIIGESGVGKELVARAVHRESDRRDAPFVAVNCAGIPENLLETEFFGHESGAFTGANQARDGLFRAAHHGTILLDEVGDLPLGLQAKLLRVLQERAVRRVGANDTHPIDVRVLVATNCDLEAAVAGGTFRQDLFYRLSTYLLEVPPLRHRGADIDLLATHFLAGLGDEHDPPVEGFSPEVLDHLRTYQFPGNVRELENLVERAVTFCTEGIIDLHHLPERVLAPNPSAKPSTPSIPDTLLRGDTLPSMNELKTRYIEYVLERTDGNKRRTAALLGISRRTLYRQLDSDS